LLGSQLTNKPSGTNHIGGTGEGQSDAAWLVPICLQLAPAVILFVGMIFMPFSPRWLIHHGREEEARKVLADLRGLDANHELLEIEFLEIKAQSLFEKRSTAEMFPHLREQTPWNIFKLQFVAIGKLFQTRAMFKRVIVATVTMFFQQVCYSRVPTMARMMRTDAAGSLVDGHQRSPVLRALHLRGSRPGPQHQLPPGHRRSRHRHVRRYHPVSPLD